MNAAGHEHGGHEHGGGADERYLAIALALIVSFTAFEVAAAFVAGSLALLADAGHMLTDVAAIGASLIAARLAARPPSETHTYGLKRAEILAAAGNGITLLMAEVISVHDAHAKPHSRTTRRRSRTRR